MTTGKANVRPVRSPSPITEIVRIIIATYLIRRFTPLWFQIAVSAAVLSYLVWKHRLQLLRWPPDLSSGRRQAQSIPARRVDS
jgi:hypothetical protein